MNRSPRTLLRIASRLPALGGRACRAACALVLALGATLPVHAGSRPEASIPRRPNVLLIVADDLGWGDLSCYGQHRFETPRLDRLAAEGTLVTQGTMAGSVCSPSRAALLTGRFPAELGFHGHLADPAWNAARGIPDALDPDVPTLPRLLGAAGYRTIHVGKWHLSPSAGAVASIRGHGFVDVRWPNGYSEDRSVNLWKAPHRARSTRELVDATLGEVSDSVRDGETFYAQLWLIDPHADVIPDPEDVARFDAPVRDRGLPYSTPFSLYAATVTAMDRELGRLLDGLDSLGVADDTLVVFTSDNGPEDLEIRSAQWSGAGSAGPLRGRKRSLYEGGIRVPWILRWPGHVPAGAVDAATAWNAVDLLPTVASLAGVALPPGLAAELDGEDLSRALAAPARRTTPLFWEWREEVVGHPWNRSPRLAVREGDWKLLLNPDRSRVELYDLAADPVERDNLAAARPDVVERLAALALGWAATLPGGRVDPRAGRDDYPWPTPTAVPR